MAKTHMFGASGRKGFTLVELLVVIAIIGVLATLVLLQLGAARGRARDAKRIADVNQVRGALELYFEDNAGDYPAAIYTGDVPTDDLKPYLTSQPVDPLTKKAYLYSYDATTRSYQLAAELEQKAAALDADADINESWSEDGTPETCASSTAQDCVYDQGIVNQ